jgi:hypothetical protein
MKDLTLTIDDTVLAEARRVANERDTTVDALIRDYLGGLSSSVTEEQKAAIARMRERSEKRISKMTGRTWTRDDLYDRRIMAWR